MKKNAVTQKAVAPKARKSGSLATLIAEVRNVIQSARHAAASAVNTLQVVTYFEIGRRIVEFEQKGESRADYGIELLKELSEQLSAEFGRGFSHTNLKLMRQFFLENRGRIGQTVSDQSPHFSIGQTLSDQFTKSQSPTGKLAPAQIQQTLSVKSGRLFGLSWSHYVLLMGIDDTDERSFYEIEAASEGWSLRELKRQVASCLYERLALSRKKSAAVSAHSKALRAAKRRQKAARSALECGMVVPLCTLSRRDYITSPDENPTVGIVLCKRKKDAIVELTLPKDANIHAREYKLYLPSKELLKKKLLEWTRDRDIKA